MTIDEAKQHVDERIAEIETANPTGELRPWCRDACPAAIEHWGLVQQRIALSMPNPHARACCADLHLPVAARSESQKRTAAENLGQLVPRRAHKTDVAGTFPGQKRRSEPGAGRTLIAPPGGELARQFYGRRGFRFSSPAPECNQMERKAYPLNWPEGWKRTSASQRVSAKFNRKEREYATNSTTGERISSQNTKSLSVADAVRRLIDELRLMGIRDWSLIISTNVPLRLDGLPRSDKEPSDPGAAVYWKKPNVKEGTPMRCMAIDRYVRVADNLAAIAATLEAMRAIERHGGATILDRAFLGFAALPERATAHWREVLGIEGAPTLELIESRFRALVLIHHPDRGGDRQKFEEIAAAREAARLELA